MSRFPQRWRTQRNAIRNANCKTSWIIKILNAHCAFGIFPVACLSECLWNPLSALLVLGPDLVAGIVWWFGWSWHTLLRLACTEMRSSKHGGHTVVSSNLDFWQDDWCQSNSCSHSWLSRTVGWLSTFGWILNGNDTVFATSTLLSTYLTSLRCY